MIFIWIRILFADIAESSDKKPDAVVAEKTSTAGTATGAAEPATATGGSVVDPAKSGSSSGRNLWVSGLSSTTRATDLKQLFSKYGKVVGAKVVTNTKMAGSRCYGYVTMSAAEDALKCVEHLHRTELHGRMISVEKAKSELSTPKAGNATSNGATNTTPTSASSKVSSSNSSNAAKSGGGGVDSAKKQYSKAKDSPSTTPRTENKPRNSTSYNERTARDKIPADRPKDMETPRRGGADRRSPVRSTKSSSKDDANRVLAAKERELQRERERDRMLRQREREQYNAERARHEREKARLEEKLAEEEKRTREIRRKAREEEDRLARERRKLELERARLEREKAELIRLERQKLEREKLELERQEIKRQQMKYESPLTTHNLFWGSPILKLNWISFSVCPCWHCEWERERETDLSKFWIILQLMICVVHNVLLLLRISYKPLFCLPHLNRVEEAKRNLKRPIEERDRSTRDSTSNYDADRDRKRPNNDRSFGGGAPPPPRFESSIR